MSFNVNFDDLSDEGLDLLMRVALKTDERQIDNWPAIGALLEQRSITVTCINDGLWSADIDSEEGAPSASEFGDHPRAAIARAVIRSHFPEGIAFRLPRKSIPEFFRKTYLAGAFGKFALLTAEMNASEDKVTVDISYVV